MQRRVTMALLAIATAMLATGCATVHPWQRGRLANRAMMFDPDASMVGFQTHWQESREGSAGGFGVQGGGCGCK